jgi:predicted ATPase
MTTSSAAPDGRSGLRQAVCEHHHRPARQLFTARAYLVLCGFWLINHRKILMPDGS